LQFRHARKAQQCRDTGAASLDYLPRPVALRKKPGLRNIGRKVRRRFHWKVATEMLCGLTIARHVWTSRRPVVQTYAAKVHYAAAGTLPGGGGPSGSFNSRGQMVS
jgi:outer membrane scaffolding protein for murein synthesis (MipA/OmpV family)